jgi:dienelactone hydrolase
MRAAKWVLSGALLLGATTLASCSSGTEASTAAFCNDLVAHHSGPTLSATEEASRLRELAAEVPDGRIRADLRAAADDLSATGALTTTTGRVQRVGRFIAANCPDPNATL